MYYKFRGKDKDTNKWVFGHMFTIKNQHNQLHYIDYKNIENLVINDTVGIYINYNDSDGVEIYSGDIVKFSDSFIFIVWFCKELRCLTAVLLNDSTYFNGYDFANGNQRSSFEEFCVMLQDPYGDFQWNGIHVIGNVFDNKDLLRCVDFRGHNSLADNTLNT